MDKIHETFDEDHGLFSKYFDGKGVMKKADEIILSDYCEYKSCSTGEENVAATAGEAVVPSYTPLSQDGIHGGRISPIENQDVFPVIVGNKSILLSAKSIEPKISEATELVKHHQRINTYLSREAICLDNNSSQGQRDHFFNEKYRNKSLADAVNMKNEFSVQSSVVDSNESSIINKTNELEKSKYSVMQKNIYLEKELALQFGDNFSGRLPYFSESRNRECFTESFSPYGKEAPHTISGTSRNEMLMKNNGNPNFMVTSSVTKESFPSLRHESHGPKNPTDSNQSLGKLFWKFGESTCEKLPVIEQSCKKFDNIKWSAPKVADVPENIAIAAGNVSVMSRWNAMKEQTHDGMNDYHCLDFKENARKWETHSEESVHDSLQRWRNVKRVNLPNSSSYGKRFEFQEAAFNQDLWKFEDLQGVGWKHNKCPSTITSSSEGRHMLNLNTKMECREKTMIENDGDMINMNLDEPKVEDEVETEMNERNVGTLLKKDSANERVLSLVKNEPLMITGVTLPKFQTEMKPKFDLGLKILSQKNSEVKPRDRFENKFEGQCLGENSLQIHHCQESDTIPKNECGITGHRDMITQELEEVRCDGKETISESTRVKKSENISDRENEANQIELENSVDLPKEEKLFNHDLHRLVDHILAKNCYVSDASKVSCGRQILEKIGNTILINDTNNAEKEAKIESEILTLNAEVKVKTVEELSDEQIKSDHDVNESISKGRSATEKQAIVVQVMKGDNEEPLYEDESDARGIESEIKDVDSFSNQNTHKKNLDGVAVEKVENTFDISNNQECDAKEQDLRGSKKFGIVNSSAGEIAVVEDSLSNELAGDTFCEERLFGGAHFSLIRKEKDLGEEIDLFDDEKDQRVRYSAGVPKCGNTSFSENIQDTVNEYTTTDVKGIVSGPEEITSMHETLEHNVVNDEELERASRYNSLRTAVDGEVVLNNARDDNLATETEKIELDGIGFCTEKEPSQENEPNDLAVNGFIEKEELNFEGELSQSMHESLVKDPNYVAKDLRLPMDVLEEGKNFTEIISDGCNNQGSTDELKPKTTHEEENKKIRFEREINVEEINISDDDGIISQEVVAVGENVMEEIGVKAECTAKGVPNQKALIQHPTNDSRAVQPMDVMETRSGALNDVSIHSDLMGYQGDIFNIQDGKHIPRKNFTIKGDDCIRILKTKMEIEYWSVGSSSLRSCGHEGGEITQLCELMGEKTDFKQMTKLKCYRNYGTISSEPLKIMSSADVSVSDEDRERYNSEQVNACSAIDHDDSIRNYPNSDLESLDISNQVVDFTETDSKELTGINEDSQDIFKASMCLEWGLDDMSKSYDLPMESPKVLDLSLDLSSRESKSSKLVKFVNSLEYGERNFSIRNKYSFETPSFERKDTVRYLPPAFSLSEVDDFACEYHTDKESCIYDEQSSVPPEKNYGHDSKTCAPLNINFLGRSKPNLMNDSDEFENNSENHIDKNDVQCESKFATPVDEYVTKKLSDTNEYVSPQFCYVGTEKDDNFNEMKTISPFQMHRKINEVIETPENVDDHQVVPQVENNEELENKSLESILSPRENRNVELDSTEQKVDDVIDEKDDTTDTVSLDAYLDTIVNKQFASEGKEDCLGGEHSSRSCPNFSNKECQTELCGILHTIHSCKCLESLLLSQGEIEICQSRGKKRALQALNLEAVATRKKIKYTPAIDIDSSDMSSHSTAHSEKGDSIVNNEWRNPINVPCKSPEHSENEIKVKSKDHLKILELHEQDWDGLEDEVVRKDCVDQEVPSATIQEDYMKGRKHEDINDDGIHLVHPVNARKESSVSNLSCGSKVLLRIGLSKRAKLPSLHHKI